MPHAASAGYTTPATWLRLTRRHKILIPQQDRNNLIPITIQPLLNSRQICLQRPSIQLIAAGMAEIYLVLVVVRLALNYTTSRTQVSHVLQDIG